MEPPAPKRIKIDDESQTEFLDLNDDCIREILSKLDLDSLCEMSLTCKRIQPLAVYQFQRKHADEDKWITVTYTRQSKRKQSAKFKPSSGEKYKNCFSSQCPNVRANCRVSDVSIIFEFLKKNCCANLIHLRLGQLRSQLLEKHGKLIEDQLNGLDGITIDGFSIKNDIYDGILKFCPNLKSLAVYTKTKSNVDWLRHSYPNLEHLDIEFCDNFHREQFIEFGAHFFHLNRQIRQIECSEINVILFVLRTIHPIEHLKLYFSNIMEFYYVFDDLYEFTLTESINSLEIVLPEEETTIQTITRLFHLKKLRAVHNVRFSTPGPALMALEHLQHLNRLSIEFNIIQDPSLITIANVSLLTNLAELDLKVMKLRRTQVVVPFMQIVQPLVMNLRKLSKITLPIERMCSIRCEDNDLIELHSIRTSVVNACPMEIHIQFEGNRKFEGTMPNIGASMGKSVVVKIFTYVGE